MQEGNAGEPPCRMRELAAGPACYLSTRHPNDWNPAISQCH